MATKRNKTKRTTTRQRRQDTPTDNYLTRTNKKLDAKSAAEKRKTQANGHIKDCHLFCKEASFRLATARLATSSPDAIEHDLQRAIDLCIDIKREANAALVKLPR